MEDLLELGEIEFLTRYGIELERVFDACGMPRNLYQEIMREEGTLIACRTNACRQGHTLKTRSGHCPCCRPAALGFLKREEQRGFVYIAHSHSLGLCKVGFSADRESRERSLNHSGYAGAVDWIVVDDQLTHAGGIDERRVYQALCVYRPSVYSVRDGVLIRASETYTCHLDVALDVLSAL